MRGTLAAMMLLAAFSASPAAAQSEASREKQSEATLEKQIEAQLLAAETRRFEKQEAADLEYRVEFAKTLKHATRIEIYLIDYKYDAPSNDEGQQEKGFRLDYDENRDIQILKKSSVPAKDVAQWCEAVCKMITSAKEAKGGMGCFMPVHGICIYAGETLLFQSALCWRCKNYTFRYYTGAGLITMNGDEKSLQTLFNDALPIPEEILARFRPKP